MLINIFGELFDINYKKINEDYIETLITHNTQEYKGTYQFSKSDNFMEGKDRFKPNKEYSDTILTSQREGVVIK